MTLVVSMLVATALLEALLYAVPVVWQSRLNRRFIAVLLVPLLTAGLSGLVIIAPSVWTVAIAFVGVYRIVNILRVAEGRSSSKHLLSVAPRTSALLLGAQITLGVGWYLSSMVAVSSSTAWITLALVQVVTAAIVLASTLRRLKHTRAVSQQETLYLDQLPSVTIALPARNETRELEACLTSVIKSTYPKLEILVLDDCSQFRRTPEIIREFAHAGVRFIKGDPPRDGWLAKNQAYAKLTREASSKLILYCGVDIRLEPDSIMRLVQELLGKEKRMLCVLPKRVGGRSAVQFAVVQAARYGWELALPRRLFNRPAVLSSCWLIYKADIKAYGGFAAVSRSIAPEAYFAKRSIAGDGYTFLRSNGDLGVYSAKTPTQQRATAVRTRYPSLKRRPEMVALVTTFQLLLLFGPLAVVLLAFFGSVPPVAAMLAAAAALAQFIAYVLLTRISGTVSWYLTPLGAIVSTLADLALMHVSMWKYEFSEVTWKDRNICMPVMRVEKKLPDF